MRLFKINCDISLDHKHFIVCIAVNKKKMCQKKYADSVNRLGKINIVTREKTGTLKDFIKLGMFFQSFFVTK